MKKLEKNIFVILNEGDEVATVIDSIYTEAELRANKDLLKDFIENCDTLSVGKYQLVQEYTLESRPVLEVKTKTTDK